MRLALFSNAPWAPTGYGSQTAELVPKLVEDGHDVAVLANYGLAGGLSQWDAGNGRQVPVYPHGLDGYSNDLSPYQAQEWTAKNERGWTLCLYDAWVIKGPGWAELNIAAWAPVDHKPVPAPVLAFFKEGTGKRLAIAMSRFGEQEYLAAGLPREQVLYAPHSIDTRVFRPTKSDVRKQLNIPEDAHLTIINAANKGLPPRKSWPEMLLAWRTFAQKRKDAFLYIHSDIDGIAGGFKIARFLEAIEAPEDRIRYVPQYPYKVGLPNTVVAQLYSASDVLLSTSRGEGFGIATVEAQACGIPAITTDWTAQPELTGVGWRVDGQPDWDEHQGAWWKIPNVDLIVEALDAAYEKKGDREMAATAVAFASQYDTAHVYETYWRPILARLDAEMPKAAKARPAPNPTIRPNRKARRKAA